MKTMSAREAGRRFGHMIDAARVEPVVIGKHSRSVVVEEFERPVRSQTAPGVGLRKTRGRVLRSSNPSGPSSLNRRYHFAAVFAEQPKTRPACAQAAPAPIIGQDVLDQVALIWYCCVCSFDPSEER